MKEFEVKPDDIGARADIFVTSKYPQFTRSSLEGLFDDNKVSAEGQPLKPSYKIKAGDRIMIEDDILMAAPEDIDLPIIYEDEDVVVIDKPAGILTHSKGVLNTEATVASFIKGRLADQALSGNRAGIVHRLDRQTSGVIIAGKTTDSVRFLQKQFSQRKVKKVYMAIVEGEPELKEAIIDAPMMRNPRKPQTFVVDPNGKPAITRYKVLKTFTKGNILYSLLELRPETGRTHQLRVHMAYIGHPIVGDRVYGKEADSMMLHAASLEITLPNRERKVFTAETPVWFKEFTGL